MFGANEALRLGNPPPSPFPTHTHTHTLIVELTKQRKSIDTLVVCPYYINTGMFDGVKSKIPFLLPILDEKYVADRIVGIFVLLMHRFN